MLLIRQHQKQAGFTLIEVMVALAIVAFTVPALMMLMMQQADNAGNLRNKAIATWVAENTLTRLRLERELNDTLLRAPLEETVTMAGVEWVVLTEPEQTAEGSLLLYRTKVALKGEGLIEDTSLVTLDMYVN